MQETAHTDLSENQKLMCVLIYERNLISSIYSYIFFPNWEVFYKKGKIKNKTIIQFGVEENIFILEAFMRLCYTAILLEL